MAHLAMEPSVRGVLAVVAYVRASRDKASQVKVWLVGISPMVWRRVLVPSTCTLGELHGVIQVAMGWEGI